MRTTTKIFLAVLAFVFQSSSAQAQLVAANTPFGVDTATLAHRQQPSDTPVNIGKSLDTVSVKPRPGFRVECGEANSPNFQYGLGVDIWVGNLVIQADYRSYGGDARPNNRVPTAEVLGLLDWFPNGSPTITPIADLPTTYDGIDEFTVTVGKSYSCLHGSLILMPSVGLGAVSRNYVHYHNCNQVSQPGTGVFLIIPFSSPETYYKYDATTESEVNITMPLSFHAVLEFSSWIGISLSGWTDVGSGGTSGWSAGLEIGGLP